MWHDGKLKCTMIYIWFILAINNLMSTEDLQDDTVLLRILDIL